MISEQMQELINHLIQVELNSAYLYLAMANYFNRRNLTGMGTWLQLQHQEELTHAQDLIKYLTDQGGVVEIRPISAQPVEFGSPLEAWQQVLDHEQYVTQTYQKAYEMALNAQDYQTATVFHDFLREQVDETAQSMRIVGRLRINQENPAGLLLLDQELGQRAG